MSFRAYRTLVLQARVSSGHRHFQGSLLLYGVLYENEDPDQLRRPLKNKTVGGLATLRH